MKFIKCVVVVLLLSVCGSFSAGAEESLGSSDFRELRRLHKPYPAHGRNYPWKRWRRRPPFRRPSYDFDWVRIRAITCTAQDARESLYPVTQNGYVGYTYLERMNEIQNAALDRCYSESGGDTSCTLLGCTAHYR